jgi:glyoxylase-like metal-dependent hydrolase (beta-lactamase superfamily II)
MEGSADVVPVRRIALLRFALLACMLALASGASGCGESRYVPRIEPDLPNWQEPYSGTAGLRLHAFDTGTMYMPEGAVLDGGSWFRRRRLNVPAFVVELPGSDLVVFDTGLNEQARSVPYGYVGFLLATLNRLEMPAGAELAVQMKTAGLDPARVRYVVLSHLHFDHTGALAAFPNATVVTGRGEKDEALAAGGFFDPFHEEDWSKTGHWVEIDYASGQPYATFTSHHDLLGDGAIVLVDVHGHTRGSQAMIVRAPGGPILLTGDAAWADQSWLYAATPVSAGDMDAWWEQIWRIKKFAQLVPNLLVVAGHDLARIGKEKRADIVVHALPASGSP